MHLMVCQRLSARFGPSLIVLEAEEPSNLQYALPLVKISIFQWPPLVLERPLRIRSKSPTEAEGRAGKRTCIVTVKVVFAGTLWKPLCGTVAIELDPLNE